MKTNLRMIAVAALALAAACGSQKFASIYIVSQTVTAANGALLQVTAAEDATYAGTAVEVPARALAQDTIVTIAPGTALQLPAGATAAGPVAAFGPTDVALGVSIRVTLPFTIPAGETVDDLQVRSSSFAIPHASLVIDQTHNIVTFTAAIFDEYGPFCQPQPDAGGGCAGAGGQCVFPDMGCAGTLDSNGDLADGEPDLCNSDSTPAGMICCLPGADAGLSSQGGGLDAGQAGGCAGVGGYCVLGDGTCAAGYTLDDGHLADGEPDQCNSIPPNPGGGLCCVPNQLAPTDAGVSCVCDSAGNCSTPDGGSCSLL